MVYRDLRRQRCARCRSTRFLTHLRSKSHDDRDFGSSDADQRPINRRFWLLIDYLDAELCHCEPSGQPDLTNEARSQAFVDWYRGARSWRNALRARQGYRTANGGDGGTTLEFPHSVVCPKGGNGINGGAGGGRLRRWI